VHLAAFFEKLNHFLVTLSTKKNDLAALNPHCLAKAESASNQRPGVSILRFFNAPIALVN
jgi:hypothetical protein